MSTQKDENAVTCVCHGPARPHPAHRPCDKDCQPDWHRDDCAIYERLLPGSPS